MDKKALIAMLKAEGRLVSESVISAIENVPRENFVLPEHRKYAYEDIPLPILAGQTISAPHMYAMMLELAGIKEGEKVLEVGTGSGYGAALISQIVGAKQKVFSIEVLPELVRFAKENLNSAGIRNAEVIERNGNLGLEEEAPFDKIIVTAGAPEIPPRLIEQLREGGKIVIPVGGHFMQELFVGTKKKGELELENYGPVVFVPLVKKNLCTHQAPWNPLKP